MVSGWASVEELERRVTAWFRATRGVEPFFLGRWCYGSEFGFRARAARLSGQTMDVVCFGDFLFRLLEIKRLPVQNIRLWVLSHAAKDCIIRLLDLPSEAVGVIPRYELFPRHADPSRVPDPNEPISFVYAGRLSVAKNFPFCLDVVSALQTKFATQARLFVFGTADDFGDIAWGVRPSGIKQVIESKVRALPWREPPRFYGKVGADVWPRFPLPNPVLLTLSRYYMEDFGVSVAQAQQAGWPVVVSDWGGHKDVMGSGVLRISSHDLNEPNEHEEIIRTRAELVACEIHKWLLTKKDRAASTRPQPQPQPQPLVSIERDQIASSVKKLESRFRFPLRRWSHIYFEGKRGNDRVRVFFRQYLSAFETQASAHRMRVLLFSPHGKQKWQSHNEILPALTSSWLAANRERDYDVIHVSWGCRSALRSLGLALTCDLIVATQVSEDIFYLMLTLRHSFGHRAPFFMHLHGEASSGMLPFEKLLPHLTTADTFLCASKAEARALQIWLKNATTVLCPFPLEAKARKSSAAIADRRSTKAPRLVYAGRVSSQKNLDHVLLALARLPAKIHLDVYGRSDRHGVPQLGKQISGRISSLKRMARALGVQRRARFHGHVDATKLDSILDDQKPVFISLSTNLDENFGVAAFKALQLGCPAVLSAWGGHLELKRMFPERVWLVPVAFSGEAFEIKTDDVVSAVNAALSAGRRAMSAIVVREQAERIAGKLLSRAMKRGGRGSALRVTKAFSAVAKRWHREYGKPERALFWFGPVFSSPQHRIFADWQDAELLKLIAAYGARVRKAER